MTVEKAPVPVPDLLPLPDWGLGDESQPQPGRGKHSRLIYQSGADETVRVDRFGHRKAVDDH
jgi:hypothetical protein